MYRRRVFEVANELSVDVRTVLDSLRSLGEAEVRPEAQLSESLARKVRLHLNGGGAVPERRRGAEMTYSTGSWQALGICAICCGRHTVPDCQ